MVSKGYYKRIAESKARLDDDMRRVAESNPGLDAAELKELIDSSLHTCVTEEYAEELVSMYGVRSPSR